MTWLSVGVTGLDSPESSAKPVMTVHDGVTEGGFYVYILLLSL